MHPALMKEENKIDGFFDLLVMSHDIVTGCCVPQHRDELHTYSIALWGLVRGAQCTLFSFAMKLSPSDFRWETDGGNSVTF